MDQIDLRRRLSPILEAEEEGDWTKAEQLCDELNRDLREDDFENSPEIVNQFLDDGDIREKDSEYGEAQRREVRQFVETGEYEDSKPVPLWSCGLVAALIGGAVIWLLT